MNDLITIAPEIQSGTPVFAGTRVPVKNLFDYLKSGDTIDEFLEDFPSVKREQAKKVLLDENLLKQLKNLISKVGEIKAKIKKADESDKIIEIDIRDKKPY